MIRILGILVLACFVSVAIPPRTAGASAAGEDRPLRPKGKKERKPDPPPPKQREKKPPPTRPDPRPPVPPPAPVTVTGVVVVNEYLEGYDYYYDGSPHAATLEETNLGLTLLAMIANSNFVMAGQTREVVAGFGVGFGITSLLFAARPGSDYRVLDVLAGAASLALAYLNLQASSSPTDRFTDLSQSTSRVGAQSRSVGAFSMTF